MKKNFIYLMLSMVALVLTAAACSDDDKIDEKDVQMSQLPEIARSFVYDYFGDEEFSYCIYDSKEKEYDVYFKSGAEIEFYADGRWKDVKAAIGKSIPMNILPSNMATFIRQEYAPAYPVEVETNHNGYEVDMSDGLDLFFDEEGIFKYAER